MKSVAAGIAALGVATSMLLVGVPLGIRYGRTVAQWIVHLLTGDDSPSNEETSKTGTVVVVAWVVAVLGFVVKAIVKQAKKMWIRLGGVILGLGMLALLLASASLWANGKDQGLASVVSIPGPVDASIPWAWLVVVPYFLVYSWVPAHRLSLAGIYRKRLAGTFAVRRAGPGSSRVTAMTYLEEAKWSEYANAPGPSLMICATAHTTRRQAGGLRAVGFTYDAAGVELQDGTSKVAWSNYPTGSWWAGFPRGWIPTRTAAITGAAIASAMARSSLGTTNAVLAATNLKLGMWVPNPRRLDAFDDTSFFPRVSLKYLFLEIFGRYDLDDPFVYVADGGHRDNLGLVDLLRQRPKEIFVVDASGDTRDKFTTFRQAIDLAAAELGAHIEITDESWKAMHPSAGQQYPLDCVLAATVSYPGDPADPEHFGHQRSSSNLYYGKYQVCLNTGAEITQFQGMNPIFPDYSTGDQFLAEAEFDQLVAIGDVVAARLIALRKMRVDSVDSPSRLPSAP